MLRPAGSAQRTMYESVLRPAAEFMRKVEEVSPVVASGFMMSPLPDSPLPDKPLPDKPLPDRPFPDNPLVIDRPLTIDRPLVATSSLSADAPASSASGAW